MDFNQAVHNVIAGKTANGAASSPFKMQFSGCARAAATSAALVMACEALSRSVKDGLNLADDQTLTAFITKMANHSAKQGWRTPEQIERGFEGIRPTLADAIMENPAAMTGKAGISGLIKGHFMRTSQKVAALRESLIHDNSASPSLVLSAGGHILVELLAPAHLKHESAVLEHCTGTNYNAQELAKRGLSETDPGAEVCLTYALKIRSGESRIFSLRGADGQPVATLEYDSKAKAIVQIEGNPRKIALDAPFFPDLCAALDALRNHTDIVDLSGGIRAHCLPDMEPGEILDYHGRIREIDEDIKSTDIMVGTIRLPANMPAGLVVELAACPGVTLDITDLTNEECDALLPEIVRADILSSRKEPVILGRLKEAGNIRADQAASVSLPVLQQAGDIRAGQAASVSLPLLQQAGDISASKATSLSLPLLQRAGDISADKAASVFLPLLKQAGNIFAIEATSLSLPLLQRAGNITASKATSLSLPLLQRAGNIFADQAVSVFLSVLQEAEEICVSSATSVSLQLLQQARDIRASKATSLSLPLLQRAGYINASNASSLSLPQLQQAGDIKADKAASVSLLVLQQAGEIWVDKAVSVSLPQLQKFEYIYVPSASKILLPPDVRRSADIQAAPKPRFFDMQEDFEAYHLDDLREVFPSPALGSP